MKKSIGICLFVIGIFFYLLSVSLNSTILYFCIEEFDYINLILLICFSILIFISGLIMEIGIRFFEGDYAYKNSRRLQMFSYIGLVMTFLGTVAYIGIGNLTNDNQIICVLLVFCVVYVSILYMQSYFNFANNKKTIVRIIKEDCLNKDRRYTMLVEKTIPDKKNSATAVCGIIHGEVRIHDNVYAYVPGAKFKTYEVIRIRAKDRNVKSAKNEACAIYLNEYMNEEDIPMFTAISSIKPYQKQEHIINSESPQLCASLGEYINFIDNKDFMSLLIYQIVHSSYIVPVQLANIDSKGKKNFIAELTKGTNFMFTQVSRKDNPNNRLLPIYTDWNAVYKWNHLLDDVQGGAISLRFNEIIEIAEKGYDGITINPFGPNPFLLSEEFIDKIKNLPGYKQEFMGENNEKQESI